MVKEWVLSGDCRRGPINTAETPECGFFQGTLPAKAVRGTIPSVSGQTEQPVCSWFSPGQDWWVVQGWLSWQQDTYQGPMSSCLDLVPIPGTREREGGEGAERERREEKEGSERKEGRKEREGEERGRRVWRGGKEPFLAGFK